MVLLSFSAFVMGVWGMLLGPLMGETGNTILDMIRADTHSKYLVVFLVPVGLYTLIVNWMGFKVFRHA